MGEVHFYDTSNEGEHKFYMNFFGGAGGFIFETLNCLKNHRTTVLIISSGDKYCTTNRSKMSE